MQGENKLDKKNKLDFLFFCVALFYDLVCCNSKINEFFSRSLRLGPGPEGQLST